MTITAQQILDAVRKADSERHQAEQIGWMDADDPTNVEIDGKIDFYRVAEILTASSDGAKDLSFDSWSMEVSTLLARLSDLFVHAPAEAHPWDIRTEAGMEPVDDLGEMYLRDNGRRVTTIEYRISPDTHEPKQKTIGGKSE